MDIFEFFTTVLSILQITLAPLLLCGTLFGVLVCISILIWKYIIKSAIREANGNGNDKPLDKAFVKSIAIQKMTNDGIKVNDLTDLTNEFGNKFQGTLHTDKGIYNASIWADKSGSVNYSLSEKEYR